MSASCSPQQPSSSSPISSLTLRRCTYHVGLPRGAGQRQTGGRRLLFSPVVGLAHRTDIPPRLEIGPMVSSPAGAVKPAVPGKKAAAERCSAAVSFGFTGPATPPAGGGSGRAPPRRWCGAWPPCPGSACPSAPGSCWRDSSGTRCRDCPDAPSAAGSP